MSESTAPLPTEAAALHEAYQAALRQSAITTDQPATTALLAERLPLPATLPEQLAQLETLKGWLDSFRPLPPSIVAELRQLYTVRLTYHSNAIEGNTLTQHETEMVLSHGITVGGKTLVEHLEVIGHRDAMAYMEELATPEIGNAPLGEWEIRNLHSLILRPVDQVTGENEAGRYRALDVRAAGTEHLYPPHYQVPELMQAFAAWLQSAEPQALHPIVGAALAHYRFVSIHPFRDGNGRTGRLLMNLWLVRAGYPIAVITNPERAAYIDALVWGQSHDDDVAPLTALIAHACRASLFETLSVLSTASESRGRGAAFYQAALNLLAR